MSGVRTGCGGSGRLGSCGLTGMRGWSRQGRVSGEGLVKARKGLGEKVVKVREVRGW